MCAAVRRRRATVRERAVIAHAGPIATGRVGDWPLGKRAVPEQVTEHAVIVWDRVRRAVLTRADALARETRGGGRQALEGQVDLVLVALLGAHLSICDRCWSGEEGQRSGDLLTAAVKKRPAGAVLKAAELEARARRREMERGQ
jgi:hypothetical protein